MNILQFEPSNLEFICKRYEITSFGIQKPKLNLLFKLKTNPGFPLQEIRGTVVITEDGEFYFQGTEDSF
jgi:hypothetical protein